MDTYYGQIRTPADAIKLFEACRLGLLPRVQRRLSEKERQSIKSGSVFVWDEKEAGMRRWTDGKSWSASRVAGSFLTYREMEGKRGGGAFGTTMPRRSAPKSPDGEGGSGEEVDVDAEGPDGYRYKLDGLMKQSFSITTSSGQHLHLISYYSRPAPHTPELKQPTQDAALRHIVPVKGMYPESTVHETQAPAATRTMMEPYIANSPQQHYPQVGGSPNQRPMAYPYSAVPMAYGWPPTPAHTPPYHPAAMYPSGGGVPHPQQQQQQHHHVPPPPPPPPPQHGYQHMSYSYHMPPAGYMPPHSHYQQSPPLARTAALPPPHQSAHLRQLAPYQGGPSPSESAPYNYNGYPPHSRQGLGPAQGPAPPPPLQRPSLPPQRQSTSNSNPPSPEQAAAAAARTLADRDPGAQQAQNLPPVKLSSISHPQDASSSQAAGPQAAAAANAANATNGHDVEQKRTSPPMRSSASPGGEEGRSTAQSSGSVNGNGNGNVYGSGNGQSVPSISHIIHNHATPTRPHSQSHPTPPFSSAAGDAPPSTSDAPPPSTSAPAPTKTTDYSRSSTPLSIHDAAGSVNGGEEHPPKANSTAKAAKTHPHDRVDRPFHNILGEDKRAIRVLDRKFCI